VAHGFTSFSAFIMIKSSKLMVVVIESVGLENQKIKSSPNLELVTLKNHTEYLDGNLF